MNGPEPSSILIVEDDARFAERMRKNLGLEGYLTEVASDGVAALEILSGRGFDLVLCDVKMDRMGGLELLKRIRSGDEAGVDPDVPFIFLTSVDSVETGVAAVKAGAADYLTKDTDRDTILLRIEKALSVRKIERENRLLRGQLESESEFGTLIAESDAMKAILREVEQYAPSRLPVLITGETGVGKEIVARAIHERSDRRDKPFLPVNCAALPDENLFHSELFGHEKGSFTGAFAQKKGKFEMAEGGTLFLDEAGDLSLDSQGKLLRFLDDFQFERLGGSKRIKVDVRVVSATNRDLAQKVEEGLFRRDLYYRLNAVSLHIPPLHQRKADIPALARHYAQRFARRAGHTPPHFTPEAMDLLCRSPWPGNVRELRNVVERLVIRYKDAALNVEALQACGVSPGTGGGMGVVNLPPGGAPLEAIEEAAVLQALEQAGWVQKDAAQLLHISEDRMNARVRKFGITHPSWKSSR